MGNAHIDTCAHTHFMGPAWTLICLSWDKTAKSMLESGALLVITFKKFSESGKCTTAGYSEGDSETSVYVCVCGCVVRRCSPRVSLQRLSQQPSRLRKRVWVGVGGESRRAFAPAMRAAIV